MRVPRLALLIGSITIVSLAVAGFATFSTGGGDDDAPTRSEWGTISGQIAARSFIVRGSGTLTAVAEVVETVDDSSEESDNSTRIDLSEQNTRNGYLMESEVRTLIETYFEPADVDRALRLAWCTSSFNTRALNPVTGAAGLFAIYPNDWLSLTEATGFRGAEPRHAEANVAAAAWIVNETEQAWTYWNCNS